MIAIYARQSIDRPDSVSIDAQIEQCLKVATGETRVYSDAGYSGKNINRPEFERLMHDIECKKITTVISYRLDRVSRNIVDFANLLKLFEQRGVNYISATEQFDTSSPMGRAMIYIVMVFAQLERETIATRIADNYRFRATKGLFMGGNTPFGYTSKQTTFNGKKVSILEPDENATLLQRIFNKFCSRESLVSISHELNQEGARTAKGNTWSSTALKRVLRNISPCCADERIYNYLVACGFTVSNSIDDFDGEHGMCLFLKNKNRNQATEISDQIATIGIHKPLVSSEQYIRVQQILNENAPLRGKRSSRTFLAGMIKCKECGHSFGVKYTSKGDKEYAYYRCRGREGRGICSNNLFVSAAELENAVIDRCKLHLREFSFSETIAEPDKTSGMAFEVELLKEQIQNLINNIGKGNSVVDNLLTKKITSLQKQIDDMTAEVKKADCTVAIDKKTIEWLKRDILNFHNLSMQQKIDIMRSLISVILIDSQSKIEIEYLF